MSGIGTPELIILILWFVALFFIARLVLLVLKAPKRIEELEKRVRKLENKLEEKDRG